MYYRLRRLGIFCAVAAMAASSWARAADPVPAAEPVVAAAAEDAAEAMPFTPGERIVAKLYWSMFYVGSAVFEVHPIETYDGQEAYKFVMKAKTNAFADKIYKVRENITSYTTKDLSRSLHYSKHHTEGKDTKEIEVDFDWEKNEVTYSNFDEARNPVALKPNTHDPLGVFYYARWAYKDGMTSMDDTLTDGKKVVESTVTIVRKERIEVNGRTYDTILIEPDLKDVGGVFKKTKNAKLQVWLTDDDRRVPVKITSKVVVGSFTAYVTDVQQVSNFETNTAESVISSLEAQEGGGQTAGEETAPAKPSMIERWFGRD